MLDSLLAKVKLIHESLGGDRGDLVQKAVAKGDKFGALRIQIEVKLHEANQVQDERDKVKEVRGGYCLHRESPDVIKLKYRIRGCLKELEDQLSALSDVFEKQKKKPEVRNRQKYNELDLAGKGDKLDLLKRQVQDVREREEGGEGKKQKPAAMDWLRIGTL